MSLNIVYLLINVHSRKALYIPLDFVITSRLKWKVISTWNFTFVLDTT